MIETKAFRLRASGQPAASCLPVLRRSFTRLDQVAQLVGASEADAELGFMARLLALCRLPRTTPATAFNTSGSMVPTRWR